ncbi:hypothetical protein O181_103667 [Austropuccinia psidii MF-1]|uniref:Uncharacterized protein n=1 Tax=Austropuccinia psidii MF-1 TaxID=1389203 RepID=A0A9Q3JK68_9BASI|nr:hypothetical protein [Austropuccinia psidii MF-1]
MVCGPYAAVCGPWGLWEASRIKMDPLGPGMPWTHISPTWPGPIERVQDHQYSGLPKAAGEVLVLSSKTTELIESSPSVPPPSVLCGLASSVDCLHPPWRLLDILIPPKHMTVTRKLRFSILPVLSVWPGVRIVFNTKILNLQSAITVSLERGHVVVPGFQLLMSGGIYAVGRMGLLGKRSQFLRHLLLMELQGIPIVSNLNTLIKIDTDILDVVTGSRQRYVARWTNIGWPIYSSSEVPISRINTEVVVKRIRRISNSPTDPDAEGSDELAVEEVVVVPHSVDHQSSTSSSQPLANRFQSQVIPSTPKTFQPVLVSIPTSLPPAKLSTSHSRPALNQEVRPSPNQQPRNSPITTSQQLQPMASSSRQRDELSPLPFPATQVFQRRNRWPIRITREDPNMVS